MSTYRLVEQRKNRINLMKASAESKTLIALKEGKEWLSKKRFIAEFMEITGVRERLALEYFKIHLDMETFEENGTTEFRHAQAYRDFQTIPKKR
jgi:hypothetical protein